MFRPHLGMVSIGLVLFPLVDVAIKGTVVLLLAWALTLRLRRDSAATRHLVWATAVMLLLALPPLSLVLPEWGILPHWSQPRLEVASADDPSPLPSVDIQAASPTVGEPRFVADEPGESGTSVQPAPAIGPHVELPPASLGEIDPGSAQNPIAIGEGQVAALVVIAWLAGCTLVLLRLGVAAGLLRKSARRSRAVPPRHQPGTSRPNDDFAPELALRTAVDAAAGRLGLARRVRLLLDPGPSMPVVWGILRPRLRLPAEAVRWSPEQQQSVVLHELAHVRRHDLVILLLTQLACAIHWFNPLVWLAAWRLHIERERACDDLVLGTGVRQSTYAGHLVEVVSRLRPGAWTRSFGLAMARPSSLESRLAAVLSGEINRRGLTRFLIAAVFLAGAIVAIPLAMLHSADGSQDAASSAGEDESQPADPQGAGREQDSPEPGNGAALASGTEDRLQWGEPAGGLRAALVRPQALGQRPSDETFDFLLVVQNVTDAPIRLNTASAAQGSADLKLRKNGVTLAVFHHPEAPQTDIVLNPGMAAVERLFSVRTEGHSIATDDPAMAFSAELTIENAPEGAWSGKLVTAETVAMFVAHGLMPKHRDAQALFRVWSAATRGDATIPGALIGQLAESIKTFARYNPTWETTPRLLEMLSRFDASHDWKGHDALALLDDLAAVQDTPIHVVLENEGNRTVRTGAPLPQVLAEAPWGEPLPNGLRLAWLLEPRAAEHRLGTPLASRILIHNAGETPVIFRTRTWHQGSHHATDADGALLNLTATSWTTRAPLVPFRLAPGEFVELSATGIGVGANINDEDWQNTRVGSWIDCHEGEIIKVTTEPVPLADWNEELPLAGEPPGWWLDLITASLSRHRPLPADAAERERIMYRVAIELIGTPFSAEETEAFVEDREPTAIDSIAKRLAQRDGIKPYTGLLQSASTTFHVLAADPDSAKRPRTATNPGRYTLAENAVLAVTRRPLGDRIVNEATIEFYSPDAGSPAPAEPRELTLPDGYDTWAAAWVRGGTVLWLEEAAGMRSYDFADPANVKEQALQPDDVPPEIHEALRRALPEPGPKPDPRGERSRRSPPASGGP